MFKPGTYNYSPHNNVVISISPNFLETLIFLADSLKVRNVVANPVNSGLVYLVWTPILNKPPNVTVIGSRISYR